MEVVRGNLMLPRWGSCHDTPCEKYEWLTVDVKKQDLGWEKRIDYRFSVWGTSQNGSSNLLARSTYDILLRYVHLCVTRQCRGGCQWRQEKGLVCLIWPLLQMSSLPAVYSFHLVHIMQKHFQTNPDFRGQATKSLASSDLVCRRVVNWWLVLCCCRHQQRRSERQSSPPRHPSSSGTGIWGILAHSQVMGSSCKPAAWMCCAKPSSGQQDWNDFLESDVDLLLSWSCYDCSTTPCVLWLNGNYPFCFKAEVTVITARDPFWPQTMQ